MKTITTIEEAQALPRLGALYWKDNKLKCRQLMKRPCDTNGIRYFLDKNDDVRIIDYYTDGPSAEHYPRCHIYQKFKKGIIREA